jgi:hypothetical protein
VLSFPWKMKRGRSAERLTEPLETREVAIPVPLFIRGLQLVENGRFDSFDSVVAAGLDILTRPHTAVRSFRTRGPRSSIGIRPANLAVGSKGAAILSPSTPSLPAVPISGVPTSVGPPAGASAWPILAFTVPRLLPVKAVLRAVAEVAVTEAKQRVDIDTIQSRLGVQAFGWRAALEALDLRRTAAKGERLATGFPSMARDGERSLRRFIDTYLGGFYADGRATGALVHLGFLDMLKGEEGDEAGLTPAGLAFAGLRNPVMDGGEARFPPFTPEETDFFIRHLAGAHLAEAEHMGEYLLLLSQRRGVERDAICSAMRRFYVRFWTPNDLTADMVNSLRMSVHSRCQELGLAVAEHEGRNAGYRITEFGERTLGFLQSLKSTPDKAGT